MIGHRYVENHGEVYERLFATLEQLLKEHVFVEFLIGRSGEFDEIAASTIKKLKKTVGNDRCFLTLVLPYPIAHLDDYWQYYDDIIFPNDDRLHYKRAISTRNEWMLTQSDLLVAYVEKEIGNAHHLLMKAKELKIPYQQV